MHGRYGQLLSIRETVEKENTVSTTTRPKDPRSGVVIGRIAYPQLFEPKRFGETRTEPGTGDPKYGCSVIAYDKFAPIMKDAVLSAMTAAIDAQYPNAQLLKQAAPRGLRGTANKDPIIKSVDQYPRMWPEAPDDAIFVRLTSLEPPTLVDHDMQPLSVEQAKLLLVTGCWVRASFNAFHYTQGGDPGISLGLNHIQYLRPGKKFGSGRGPASDLLDSVDPEALFAGFKDDEEI